MWEGWLLYRDMGLCCVQWVKTHWMYMLWDCVTIGGISPEDDL